MIMESHLQCSELSTYNLKTLEPSVVEVIDKLKEMYAKCINDHHINKNRKFRNKRHDVIDPNFKATVMKKYEGFEKTLALIRTNLQKLTEHNFDKLKLELVEHITQIITSDNKDEIYRMCETIINEFSKNPTFSVVMAKLYNDLLEIYKDDIDDMLNIFIKNYDDIITNIKSTDGIDNQGSQQAYDEFCLNNDKNRLRQSMGLFMVNIMKYNIIEVDYVINIINYFQDMLIKTIYEKDKKSVVDELTENIYILVVNSKDHIKDVKEWDNIIEKVNTLTKIAVKDCLSLTSRSKFKHMDILDSFKQKQKQKQI